MITAQNKPPMIGPESRFYGYLTGLFLAPNDLDDNIDNRLFAIFEYRDEQDIWEVPDEELFNLLSKYLNSMAWERKNSDSYGISKLYIEKNEDDTWSVELP